MFTFDELASKNKLFCIPALSLSPINDDNSLIHLLVCPIAQSKPVYGGISAYDHANAKSCLLNVFAITSLGVCQILILEL